MKKPVLTHRLFHVWTGPPGASGSVVFPGPGDGRRLGFELAAHRRADGGALVVPPGGALLATDRLAHGRPLPRPHPPPPAPTRPAALRGPPPLPARPPNASPPAARPKPILKKQPVFESSSESSEEEQYYGNPEYIQDTYQPPEPKLQFRFA